MTTLTRLDVIDWFKKNIQSDIYHMEQPIEINVHLKCKEDLDEVKYTLGPDPYISGKFYAMGKDKQSHDWSEQK